MHPLKLILAIGFLFSVATAMASVQPITVRHSSGVDLLGPIDRQPKPLPDDLAGAWTNALRLAEAHPDDLGYPYADSQTGTLVLRVARAAGDLPLATWLTAGATLTIGVKEVTLPPPTVPYRIQRGARSYGELEKIKNEISDLRDLGVRGSALIQASSPDHRLNRVIFTARKLDDSLINDLAALYGTAAIAVRIEDQGDFHLSRHDDTSPFTGGAQLVVPGNNACTSGFSWYSSGVANYMIIAGHCTPNGGSVSTSATFLGSVTQSLHENWNPGTGTVPFTYQTAYRGDLAAVTVSGNVEGRMYKGTASTHSTAPVKEMWWRSPAVGDQYCTGGAASGELCSYSVINVGVNRYIGSDLLRNVAEGSRSGGCTGAGDSGGPVYTVRPDGGIAAKGIESSSNRQSNCIELFTDIWEAYYGLPGVLKTE